MDKKRKKLAPVVITTLIAVFSICYIVGVVVLAIKGVVSILPAVLISIAYLALCVGILKALKERIKEIDGGEEDEALKY